MTYSLSRGKLLWDTFVENLKIFRRGSPSGASARNVIWGISIKGEFVGGRTLDSFLQDAGGILLESGRVYRWEDTLCFEVGDDDRKELCVLATRQKAESNATSLLSNLLCVGVQGDELSRQSLIPSSLTAALLADQDLWQRLPVIRHYSRRPIFDDDFNLTRPGWNATTGVLVHGPDIEPDLATLPNTASASAVDRLPVCLGRLLREFCWASDADLANAVGILLTGFLANHFIDEPKPVFLLDGNQKGVGKTLLVQVLGHILDGAEPPRIPMVGDEELEKKLCAQLRNPRSSIFFFDKSVPQQLAA